MDDYFDCCGSETTEKTCTIFGGLNALILIAVVLSIPLLICCSKWFRSNWILTFTLLFQVVTCLWRAIFYLYGGRSEADTGAFISYRSSGAADFVVSLIGFSLYLYFLKRKYEEIDNKEFKANSLQKRLTIYFWLLYVVYTVYWGVFYWLSLDNNNLVYVDLAISAAFALMILINLCLGHSLIKQMNKAPGSSTGQITFILILQTIVFLTRMIFVSL